jgi:plasmid stabilization system protein ParE
LTELKWTSKALSDLARLYDFLAPVNRQAAARAIKALTAAPARLLEHPRIGARLEEFAPREVRCILVGRYEMRYEVQETRIVILRLWHTRENR